MTVVRYRLFREQQPCVSILGELIRIFSNLASRWLAKRETRLVVRSAGQTADRKPRLRSFRRRLLSGYFSDSPASSLFLSLSLSLSFTHSLTRSLFWARTRRIYRSLHVGVPGNGIKLLTMKMSNQQLCKRRLQ